MRDLPVNDWECLAVAQHFGFATRLLDWTYNPLVATYFAACSHYDRDAAVWCYEPVEFVNAEVRALEAAADGLGFIPRAISPRVLNQKAAFTVHGPPDTPISIRPHSVWDGHANLEVLIIPAAMKRETLAHLDDYGISNVTLFSDLDGLSKHMNWETAEMVERHQRKEKDRA
jgi:hypothetical protein